MSRTKLVPRPRGLSPHWKRDWPRDDGKDGFPAGQNASWYCGAAGCRYTRKGPGANYKCPTHRTELLWGGEKGLIWIKERA